MIFPRHVGPRPPNIIARAWSAMIRAATLKEWTRLGAGVAILFAFLVVVAAARFGWPAGTEAKRLDILFTAVCFAGTGVLIAMASTFEVNVKVKVDKAGAQGDFTNDDPPANSTQVQTTVTVTPPEPPK